MTEVKLISVEPTKISSWCQNTDCGEESESEVWIWIGNVTYSLQLCHNCKSTLIKEIEHD